MDESIYEIKFSSELGSLNFDRSVLNTQTKYDKTSFLEKRGLTKRYIILSLEELLNLNQSSILKFIVNKSPALYNYFFDPTVPIVNQIMFTFNRQFMYVIDTYSNENWYWSSQNFDKIVRTLKYQYDNSVANMII
jgi:hypothetical protein